MLYHHDGRDYAAASAEAAAFARKKLEGIIEAGRAKAGRTIEHILTRQPVDRVVRAEVLDFQPDETGIYVQAGNGNSFREKLHGHALGQACEKMGVHHGYAQTLVEHGDWGKALLAHNLNELKERISRPKQEKFLTRSVDGEVRGFLSDRFRRLDSRPIVEAFAMACNSVGAIPTDGAVTDTRVRLDAMLPLIYEPVPNEVMAFGITFGNSDFGKGAMSVRAFMMRLWCTNKAITEEALREIHLGRRLGDDIAWSDETYRLDTAAMVSAVGDVVRGQLAEPKINELQAAIKAAAEKEVNPREMATMIRKLNKSEAEKVQEAFDSNDVEMLPPGKTAWRLSNALSWVAGRVEDDERRVELQQFAGGLLKAA